MDAPIKIVKTMVVTKAVLLLASFKSSMLNFLKYKHISIEPIDQYEIDGDFVESQAFAYLAIRSYLKLPISFPTTTGCKAPMTGGDIIKNF